MRKPYKHQTDALLCFYKGSEKLVMMMVPKAGLEPARLAALPPQDSVSTYSTTSANLLFFLE